MCGHLSNGTTFPTTKVRRLSISCFCFAWNSRLTPATWDSPPRRGSPDYAVFERAFKNYIDARSVVVPKYSKGEIEEIERRRGAGNWKSSILGIPNLDTFDIGQGNARLMDFQVCLSSNGARARR